jgi:hypothetical protein
MKILFLFTLYDLSKINVSCRRLLCNCVTVIITVLSYHTKEKSISYHPEHAVNGLRSPRHLGPVGTAAPLAVMATMFLHKISYMDAHKARSSSVR